MPRKSRALSVLLLLLVASLLTGCTLPLIGEVQLPFLGSRPTGPVELTYWGLWEPEEVLGPSIDFYREEYPNVSIDYSQRSFATLDLYRESLLTRLQQGTGPDLARIHISWLSQFKEEIVPLPSAVMSEGGFAETFYPVALDSLKREGQIWGLPLEYDGLLLFYNTDHFSEAGLASPPVSWEEFRRGAVILTLRDDSGKLVRSGAALGAASNVDHASDILGLMWLQSGVVFPEELDSQPAQDALTFYSYFVTEDGVWDETLPNSVYAFSQGQVSMIFAPSWRYFDIAALNPEVNFATASVPQIPGNEANWASFWVEVVSKDCEQSGVAWDFLRFLSGREGARELFDNSSKLRLFGEPPARQDLGSDLSGDPILGPLLEGAETAGFLPIADSSGLDSVTEIIESAITRVSRDGEDVKSALIDAKEQLEAEFEELDSIVSP